MSGTREDRIMKRVFLSPAIAMLLLFSIFPLFWSLGTSFTDIQRGGSTTLREAQATEDERVGFLGLGFSITGQNYARMSSDSRLFATARNTIFYVFVGVVIQYVIGFSLALALNQPFWGRNIFRVIFLLPMMTTPVAAGYIGRMMFDSVRSPLADLIQSIPGWFGSDAYVTIPWLTTGAWARATIVLIDSWQWIPFMTLLLLAGLQAVPKELYEAAQVDGATIWQSFWRITFPILLPISVTVILIRGLEIFKIIDIIMVTTGGGPGSATESLTMYIFKTALTFGNYAYAAAISYVLLVLVVVFSTIFLSLARGVSARATNVGE